eukprot:CAMPEP_0194769722 /NCGR_PEP_ID=MMETSP0323_2-20130528/44054_1 /TAXON_ID=2866 ORGANISM="Crypthecodinium cohnii, Strain Seligo" /NCGR_SAMPLE_ID=MMETSP0323_2 /ASSEMBLY_ACC=CAM_ASM_000346 /LENGTH=65 /DNA_ID=CAMNT_0039702873 /DNA_START=95 /DNA_END=292 /DNA_ORIENTATION=-
MNIAGLRRRSTGQLEVELDVLGVDIARLPGPAPSLIQDQDNEVENEKNIGSREAATIKNAGAAAY